jgi:hypothetical protein
VHVELAEVGGVRGFRHTLNDLLRRDARAEVTRAIIFYPFSRWWRVMEFHADSDL